MQDDTTIEHNEAALT